MVEYVISEENRGFTQITFVLYTSLLYYYMLCYVMYELGREPQPKWPHQQTQMRITHDM